MSVIAQRQNGGRAKRNGRFHQCLNNLRRARHHRARKGRAFRRTLIGSLLAFAAFHPAAHAQTTSVTLGWDASQSAGLAGYNLYYGGVSRDYTNLVATGKTPTGTITGLRRGSTYYFAVTAVSSNSVESMFSSEISYTIPPAVVSGATLSLQYKTNRQVVLSGTAPANYGYDVLAATAPNGPTWTKLGSVTSLVSGTFSYTVPAATNKARFFRLRQNSP